jgi:hypothetical protein
MTTAYDNWLAKARAVPIEREIERRGIKLNGGIERAGPCPVCGGTDRFSINTAKQVFNCRGCGVGGDVIKLVEHLDGVGFIPACTTLTGEPPPPKPNGKDQATSKPRKIVVAEFPYHDENGNLLSVVERQEFLNPDGTFVLKDGKHEKTFRRKRPDPDHAGEWIWNSAGVPIVSYRLPQVTEAVANQRPILIVEGEAKADLLWSWNVVATCCAGGAGKWKAAHSEFLPGADVVLVPDADDAGAKHIQQVGAALNGIAKRIRVLMLPNLPPKGDIVDWVKAGGMREALDGLIERAPDWQPLKTETSDDESVKAKAHEDALLDALLNTRPGIERARRRRRAARELSVPQDAIDQEVEARRAAREAEAGPPPLFGHWLVEPWPDEVDTDALLLSLVRRLQRHVVLSHDAAVAAALWILFAWVHADAAVHSPILLVTSAEANSGKTTLLVLISFLTPRCLVCVEIGEATLFRGIELWQPTIIVDEADVILINNEPLRAVVNSGWTRGATVPRCIGDDKVPHAFPTFCPKALGMKGKKLPDTTLSRSITIEMKRKHGDENVEHFRAIDDAGLADLHITQGSPEV